MRLSQQDQESICGAVLNLDPLAQIYLYGSRTRDDLKGGDVDLLIISDLLEFSHKISVLSEIKAKLGDQKIDLLIKSPQKAAGDPFVVGVLQNAVRLR